MTVNNTAVTKERVVQHHPLCRVYAETKKELIEEI